MALPVLPAGSVTCV